MSDYWSEKMPEKTLEDPSEIGIMHDNNGSYDSKDRDEKEVVRSGASTTITSFSVTLDKKIDLKQKKGEKEDFGILNDRDLLVSIATTEERWLFENINTDIILCEIVEKIRSNPSVVKVTPIELLAIGREIGRFER